MPGCWRRALRAPSESATYAATAGSGCAVGARSTGSAGMRRPAYPFPWRRGGSVGRLGRGRGGCGSAAGSPAKFRTETLLGSRSSSSLWVGARGIALTSVAHGPQHRLRTGRCGHALAADEPRRRSLALGERDQVDGAEPEFAASAAASSSLSSRNQGLHERTRSSHRTPPVRGAPPTEPAVDFPAPCTPSERRARSASQRNHPSTLATLSSSGSVKSHRNYCRYADIEPQPVARHPDRPCPPRSGPYRCSMMFVVRSVRWSGPVSPRRRTVSVSFSPSRMDAAALRCSSSSERANAFQRPAFVVPSECRSHAVRSPCVAPGSSWRAAAQQDGRARSDTPSHPFLDCPPPPSCLSYGLLGGFLSEPPACMS